MGDSFSVKVTGAGALIRGLERLSANMIKNMEKPMLQAAEIVRGEIVQAAPVGTGALRRSFRSALVQTGSKTITAGVFSDLPYARIQNTGGTIRPKTVKNLAIPLTPEARKLWPRDWAPGDLVFQIRRGKKLLFDRSNRLQYVLKSSVTIKGSGYLDTAAANSKDAVAQHLADAIAELAATELKKG